MITRTQENASLAATARLVGAAYVLVIVLGIGCMGFIERALVEGDPAATLAWVRAHEPAIRTAFLGEITMYLLVVVLASSLFTLVRTQNEALARLALLLRCGEAFLGASIAVVGTLFPLWLAHHGGNEAIAHGLIGAAAAGIDVVLIFMGVGGAIFFVLLWRSRLVPRLLAACGILTYVAMSLMSTVSLATDALSEEIKMFVYAPGGVFEVVFGLWLLLRGCYRVTDPALPVL